MAARQVGEGNVPITINDTEYNLIPTPFAMQQLSRLANGTGIRGVIEQVLKMDLDVIHKVIELGLGKDVVKKLGGANKLPDILFDQGYTDDTGAVVAKALEYLQVLNRGGRAAPLPGDEAADGEKKTLNS